jgi:hypothetical protein
MKPMSQKTAQEVYLEWLNDWLTVEAMADNYNIPVTKLNELINEGRSDYLIDNETPQYINFWGLINH